MARILIAGATGLLGSSLTPYLSEKGHEVITVGMRKEATFSADLTNHHEAFKIINLSQPELVINLIANTNVDLCESDINLAYRLNVLPIQNICNVVNSLIPNAHVIHLSSDMLYDGSGPQKESEIALRNIYSLSKFASELVVSKIQGTVLRTNFFGKSRCKDRVSFTDWIYQALLSEDHINLFDNVYFSPLSMKTLCEMINLVTDKRPIGIYNLGSRNGMSKADFAFVFAKFLNLSTEKMNRVPFKKLDNITARRPNDMRMDSGLFEQELHIQLPNLIDEIKNVGALYNE